MYLKQIITLLTTVSVWDSIQGDEAEYRCENYLPDTTVVLGFQEKCYQFVDREVYWNTASNYCRLYGGRLVKVDDPHTNNFIIRSLNALPWKNRGVWIGLHDRDHEHHWEWMPESGNNGEAPRWTNWGRGHPKAFLHSLRDCVRMVRGGRQDWKWHETFCAALNWKYRFICQYPMKQKTAPPKSANFYQDNSQDSNLGAAPKLDQEKADLSGSYRHVKESTVPEEALTTKPIGNTKPVGNIKLVTVVPKDDEYDYDYTKAQKIDLGEYIKPMALKEEKMESQKGITFVVLACTVAVVCIVIILVVFLVKRRKQRKEILDKTLKIENPMYDSSCDNNNDIPGQRVRVQNEYVVNVYSNPMPLAVRLLNARSAESIDSSRTVPSSVEEQNNADNAAARPSEGDGYEEPTKSDYLPMDGSAKENSYDRPKSNVYAEIPDIYAENIYETVDDIHVPKNESEA